MSMAETVGIGKRAKNSLILHAKYGPRLMLGGLITSSELPSGCWPEKSDTGCPADCDVCMKVCPVGAIGENGDVDRLACIRHSMESPLFSFLMKTKAFDPQDAAMINHVTAVDDHSWYTCIKCVSECPLL